MKVQVTGQTTQNNIFSAPENCFSLEDSLDPAKIPLVHQKGSEYDHRSLKFGPYITYIASKPKAHGVIT